MPEGYEYLLRRILKSEIQEEVVVQNSEHAVNFQRQFKTTVTREENCKGVPQGGVISPILMNWTLDGLQHFVKIRAHELGKEHDLYSTDRAQAQKEADPNRDSKSESYYKNRNRIEWYNTT